MPMQVKEGQEIFKKHVKKNCRKVKEPKVVTQQVKGQESPAYPSAPYRTDEE